MVFICEGKNVGKFGELTEGQRFSKPEDHHKLVESQLRVCEGTIKRVQDNFDALKKTYNADKYRPVVLGKKSRDLLSDIDWCKKQIESLHEFMSDLPREELEEKSVK